MAEVKHAIHARFTAWLCRVCAAEAPVASVVAFNIGLLETLEGYCAYLTGAENFTMTGPVRKHLPRRSDIVCFPAISSMIGTMFKLR